VIVAVVPVLWVVGTEEALSVVFYEVVSRALVI